ncbi:MAG: glutamate racemase [Acidobacteriota bacterium]|jgi:glutamate racemase
MSDTRPLAVFDSGVGGLTVLAALRRKLPGEPLLYLGDTARVPYGTRSDETVLRYAREATAFLMEKDVKAIVVACNTVSTIALDALADALPLPVVGVLEPGARAAARLTRNGRIGVIGTAATIRSGAYARRLKALRLGCTVVQQACPMFVPLAEEGWTDGGVPQMVADAYLSEVRRANVDTLVLGCTHYPLLRDVIAGTMGPGVTLVDSAEAAAEETVGVLQEQDLQAMGRVRRPGEHFFVTDPGERFREVGERFLTGPIERLERVALPVWPART